MERILYDESKTHEAKTFNKMGDAFNTIINHANKLSKNKAVLMDVLSWEFAQANIN